MLDLTRRAFQKKTAANTNMFFLIFSNWSNFKGSGGGASGRAMAFCPSEPGSYPRMDLLFSEMLSIYSHWASYRAGHETG